MTKEKWKTLLNLIVTIITAIAATLTTQSCMRMKRSAPCRTAQENERLPHEGRTPAKRPHATTHDNTRECFVTLLHCYIVTLRSFTMLAVFGNC